MGEIISGKLLAKKIKEEMKLDIERYNKLYGRAPHLVVILVGDDEASKSYVKGKEKASLEIGVTNTTIIMDSNTTEEELLKLIDELNNDDLVDGILVQLPLPKHIDQTRVITRISYDKDVDGFHPLNVSALYERRFGVIPCTPRGIMEILESKKIEISGKRVCVVGRSSIVGMPVAKLLLDANATVTICHSKTKNLGEMTKEADILVVAIGKPKYIKADMVKDGAIVIDVGVNKDPLTGKLCGDVDFDNVEPKASYITKVPGGVGPMTICCLLENTLNLYLKHMERKD